ncbi:hypothetical protein J2T07_001611 [Luteibacter jiangsuensis]|uniref:Uncharacterized protein n=2 Tax=Luteibacter jiangsuensis TaxID=637577 RepID=A0ABT9SWQ4_9GAMM|nr:hypothetical protein [Luteibacter jiangsuensis]
MIHHYTSAATLKLILANRTIRFRRADLLDDESEVPFQHALVHRKSFFISSWSQATVGEAGMWSRYGDFDQGVRLSVDTLRFPWSPLSLEISRGTGRLKPDGTPQRVGLKVTDLLVPFSKETFLGNGYIATPMSGDLQETFGGRVHYATDPQAVIAQLINVTNEGITVRGDGSILARVKDSGWADQAEYRFVLHAIRGPAMVYTADPAAYERSMVNMVEAALERMVFADLHPEVEFIDLPLAYDAFDDLTVTLGPAMTAEQQQATIEDVHALAPSVRVVPSALRIKPRPRPA